VGAGRGRRGYPGGQGDKGRPSPPDPLEPVPAVPPTAPLSATRTISEPPSIIGGGRGWQEIWTESWACRRDSLHRNRGPPPLRGASGQPSSPCPSGPPAYGAMLGAKGQVGSPHEGRRGYRGGSRRGVERARLPVRRTGRAQPRSGADLARWDKSASSGAMSPSPSKAIP